MKRIIIHWSAGGPIPTQHEKRCYHFLIDAIGKTHLGKFKPEANEVCRTGMYAPHTGGGNTGSIGVSMCAMANFLNKNNQGPFPITRKQFEATMKLCADLATKYKIPIKANTIMTHYEFGQKNPKTTSKGKIDIIYLPPFPWISKEDVGGFVRSKIRWYQEHYSK